CGVPIAALRALDRARRLRPQGSLPRTLAWLLAERRPPAQTLRAQAEALSAGLGRGREPLDGLEAAVLFDAAGDRDAALATLGATVQAGYRDAAYLRASPWFAALRSDPRFASMLADIDRAVAREPATVRSRGLARRAGVAASP
ncbi:MAG TPA: transcriptional regulator, partial [Xanthomonadaceae bacterium]|nr:transcriptional regulator [Xanthomonadaceae bacterium]